MMKVLSQLNLERGKILKWIPPFRTILTIFSIIPYDELTLVPPQLITPPEQISDSFSPSSVLESNPNATVMVHVGQEAKVVL